MLIFACFIFGVFQFFTSTRAYQLYPRINATGNIIEYTLVIRRGKRPHTTKYQITINGTTPGPRLEVLLGDILRVTVINEIFDDFTGIHWHGLTLPNQPWMDGVFNITQCPISNQPMNQQNILIYELFPESAGTYWYHGHYRSQNVDGK
jgi:FtsP/CotA-like multicopper oxidase with cupredoxin domain